MGVIHPGRVSNTPPSPPSIFGLITLWPPEWRKLNGSNWLAEVSEGVKFEDGIKVDKIAA